MITLTDAPDPRLESVLEDGLAAYNFEKVGRRDWRALAVTANDPESSELVGGLLGRTSLGLFFLDLFYLPERMRGGGIGSAMMRMAEMEAARRGCRAATLVTVNFQAPEFYARHGWEEFGRIDSAPGVARIFMRKNLAPPDDAP
jgi:GNAT superfamily N-acetyltransferase